MKIFSDKQGGGSKTGLWEGGVGSATPQKLPVLADASGHRERLTGTTIPSVQCDMTLSTRVAQFDVSFFSRFMDSRRGEGGARGGIFHFVLCRTSYRVAAQRGPNLLVSRFFAPFDL